MSEAKEKVFQRGEIAWMVLEGDAHAYLVLSQCEEKMSNGYDTADMVYAIDMGTKDYQRSPSTLLDFAKIERLPRLFFHETRADALRKLLKEYKKNVEDLKAEIKKEEPEQKKVEHEQKNEDACDPSKKELDLRDMEQALPILEQIHKRHQVGDKSWRCQECRASMRIGLCIYMSLKSLIEGIKKGLEV